MIFKTRIDFKLLDIITLDANINAADTTSVKIIDKQKVPSEAFH